MTHTPNSELAASCLTVPTVVLPTGAATAKPVFPVPEYKKT